MMTIEQCRAARALLGWSAQELADAALMGVVTVRRFEGGNVVAAGSIEAMAAALNAAGVTFMAAGELSAVGGDGVRLTSSSPS